MRPSTKVAVSEFLVRGFAFAGWLGFASLLAPVRAQFPDLTVTEIEISPVNPAPGQTVFVTVHAENIGNTAPLDAVYCYLYHHSFNPPNPCTADQIQFLEVIFPGNSERLFNFTVQYPTAGEFRMWAWIDGCEGLIDEWEEANNNLWRDVFVGIGDLTIESIDTTTADPVPGEMVSTRVTVRNTGPAILGQVWRVGVVFQSAEPDACIFTQTSDLFQDFAANSTFAVTFEPRIYEAPGANPVWAWVDCMDDVVEANDFNNKLAGEIVIGKPDLVVDSVTSSVGVPTQGQPFDVSVVLRNAGSLPAPAFDAAIVVDQLADPGQTCSSTRGTIAGLAVAATTTVTFSVTLSEARSYRIWGIADACALLAEAREDNNTHSLDVNVGSSAFNSPDLVIERIDVSEIPTPEWGAVTTFDVTVRNVGTVTSVICRVGDFAQEFPGPFPSYIVIGSPGPLQGGTGITAVVWIDCSWRTREIPALASGDTAVVQFWRQYPRAGRYTIAASVDVCGTLPNHAVYETSETNNTLSVDFDVTACNADTDRDGICNAADLCPNTPDPLNNDSDNDGTGDVCDDDDDNDGVLDAADCEPRNRFVFPGALENCVDGIDNDCDGQIDEGAVTLYGDNDGDGYGNTFDVIRDCSRTGYVTDNTDCNDYDATVHPGALGPCDDAIDQDCDGSPANDRAIWGRDADGDGFYNPADLIVDDDGVCDGRPAGYILVTAGIDPDDTNFFDPEPVRPEPGSILFSVPPDIVPPSQTLALVRNGPETFSYEITVEYLPDSQGFPASDNWLALDPPSGTASGGRGDIVLQAAAGPFKADYPAMLHISLNGQPAFDVSVVRTIRDPRLTIRHAGQGNGSVRMKPAFDSEPIFGFDTRQGSFEAIFSLPDGAIVEIEAQTEGDCSELAGLFDAAGNQLDIIDTFRVDADGNIVPATPGVPNPPSTPGVSTVRVAEVRMDGDQEVEARFALSGLACTTCAMIVLTLNLVGLRLARGRAAKRRNAHSDVLRQPRGEASIGRSLPAR